MKSKFAIVGAMILSLMIAGSAFAGTAVPGTKTGPKMAVKTGQTVRKNKRTKRTVRKHRRHRPASKAKVKKEVAPK